MARELTTETVQRELVAAITCDRCGTRHQLERESFGWWEGTCVMVRSMYGSRHGRPTGDGVRPVRRLRGRPQGVGQEGGLTPCFFCYHLREPVMANVFSYNEWVDWFVSNGYSREEAEELAEKELAEGATLPDQPVASQDGEGLSPPFSPSPSALTGYHTPVGEAREPAEQATDPY